MSDTPSVTRPAPQYRERAAFGYGGIPVFAVAVVLFLGGGGIALLPLIGFPGALIAVGVVIAAAGLVLSIGLTMVAPNEAQVVQFFGRYVGTIRTDGLRWVNPLTVRNAISTRIRNHETSVMKVNDASGSPIEIAAVVVWQVEDTARASFEVDDFIQFVSTQTEAAVRHIAGKYPYDSYGDEAAPSLRDSADAITEQLSKEVAERVDAAGVKIVESRFTHLAYAPEIAQAMLQRQQASAMIAARAEIVEGAVSLVDRALERLADENVVDLDEERKAAMVSNLLVVLCSDRPASPVVNTGTLYQ
ncbi:membrane protein [Nocardiopsis terrae]|uniref:Regulator of protease activity HflC (Stomatin/prohibitin superfamily) n=1 Tax=Nocardiopsis terrae TaxID=372655 RepID=A0ABR9HI03_9ACTN|nr:SPFH domain-containing protein [Nocardiopsis terrae]MBE1458561.1 regulator of protease activity HflC (stomatin/prohibitin superfamily) [Nocardiopsis terrae]GHC79751.1 membrane protein [Nocardiopsis terrae]